MRRSLTAAAALIVIAAGIGPTVLPHLLAAAVPHRLTAGGWADLRPDAIPRHDAAASRGRSLLEEAARIHGIEAWRRHHTLSIVATDHRRSGESWWPTSPQRLRLDLQLGTFTSRVTFLDGPQRDALWGLQSWAPYVRDPGAETPRFLPADRAAISFHLPRLHYLLELPFRLLSATHVRDLGRATLDGSAFDRVFVTWGDGEPGADVDQLVVWIGRSGRIEMVHHTLREAVALAPPWRRRLSRATAVATVHFDDFRLVDGVQMPWHHTTTRFGPRADLAARRAGIVWELLIERAAFDLVPASDLQPNDRLPSPDGRKPIRRAPSTSGGVGR